MTSNIIVLNSKERKHIRKQLQEQFGIDSLPEKIYFCINEKDNVYICNKELFDIDQFLLRVKTFGVVFGNYTTNGFELSIEGTQLIGKQATKNIIEVNSEQKEQWLTGEDLEVDTTTFENQFVLLKERKDFFGSGFAKKGKIKNKLPKTRTLKNFFDEDEN